MGLRPGSNAAVLVTFLTLFFIVVGAALLAMGFDLNEVDRWLDAQGGWLNALGTLLFKIILAMICLIAVVSVGAALVKQKEGRWKPSFGIALGAAVVAYFAGVGLFT